ncbi:MAG: hypothetical protein WEG36_15310 [Gemmatimonadota bacterium]
MIWPLALVLPACGPAHGEPVADRVGAHLETCARCYPMLAFEKSFLEAVSSVADDAPPPDRLKERVLRSLETEGFTAQ